MKMIPKPRPDMPIGRRNPANQRFTCMGCGALIVNKLVGVKMLPYNLDDDPHSCVTHNVKYFTAEEIAMLNRNLMSGPI